MNTGDRLHAKDFGKYSSMNILIFIQDAHNDYELFHRITGSLSRTPGARSTNIRTRFGSRESDD